MPAVYRSPSLLLKELGVSEPREIDIEAIAQYCGATIVYERLEGSEARILGNNDRAIITVNSEAQVGRRRFSAGHELGHWMRDRGKVGFSCTEQVMIGEWASVNTERAANEYAADLLMPAEMFGKESANKAITFDSARELSNTFLTSLTATAIRLVRYGSFPAMLVYLENGRRKWFIRGDDVPESLWPLEAPKLATTAADLLRGKSEEGAIPIQADGWIDHPRSKWYEVVEHSIRISSRGILSLLWWKNERQLLDLDEDE
ncbi:MAG TPA: ImmA/IrrE family metallo-endopeptidase [Terriglobales bacterium]|nr:ImmA/IrrE family metallo-endopeptidase [Terriglobales bacterium]